VAPFFIVLTMGQAGCNGLNCEADASLVVQEMLESDKACRPAGTGIRGILEIDGSTAVGAATRLALAEALAAIVRHGTSSRKGSQARVEVVRNLGRSNAKKHTLRFTYAVSIVDPVAAEAARSALQREASRGGRRRLLPSFAAALRAHGEGSQTKQCSNLRIVAWTVEGGEASDVKVAASMPASPRQERQVPCQTPERIQQWQVHAPPPAPMPAPGAAYEIPVPSPKREIPTAMAQEERSRSPLPRLDFAQQLSEVPDDIVVE